MIAMACSLLLLTGSGFSKPQDGGQEGSFLSWGAGARSLGLGKAYVALANDATATYWNPAGLAYIERMSSTFLHASLYEGTNYDFIGLAIPTLAMGNFGISATMLSTSGIERRDSFNNKLGMFSSSKLAIGISYSRWLMTDTSFGLTVKYLTRNMDSTNTSFLTFDIGLRSTIITNLALALNLQHLKSVKYGNTEDILKPQMRFGLAYSLPGLATLVADVENSGKWHMGIESIYLGPMAVRAGLDNLDLSAGVGIAMDRVTLDYSANMHIDLGLSHRFSIGIEIGDSLNSIRMIKAKESYEKAMLAYKESNHEEAKKYLEEVVKYDKDNTIAKVILERLGNISRE